MCCIPAIEHANSRSWTGRVEFGVPLFPGYRDQQRRKPAGEDDLNFSSFTPDQIFESGPPRLTGHPSDDLIINNFRKKSNSGRTANLLTIGYWIVSLREKALLGTTRANPTLFPR